MSVYIDSVLLNNEALADQQLTNARILWQTALPDSTVSGIAGEVGFPLLSIINPATYERYKPIGGVFAEIVIDCLTVKDIDYIALQSRFVETVEIEYSSDNINWTQSVLFNINNDRTAVILFNQVSFRYFRVTISGSFIEIISMMMGKSLAMQRAIHAGHAPINLSPSRVIRPNVSETGQWLGASEQRKGFSASYSWTNLNTDWYRQNFDKFVQNSPRVNPFFIAWRPKTYPDDVAYCLATNDVSPSFTGTKDFMSVSLNVEGFSDVV